MLIPDAKPKNVVPRQRASISESLTLKLNAYGLAAAASGITLLAAATPAEAAPVCRELSIELRANSTYVLNPSGQFAAPFIVDQSVFLSFPSTTGFSNTVLWWNRAFFTPNTLGAMQLLGAKGFPADLAFGANIGPGESFGKGKSYGELFTYGFGNNLFGFMGGGTKLKHRGNFNLLKENYIGFQFSEAGKVHYGWARMKVSFHAAEGMPFTTTHILGYGYETTPDTPITAGGCSGEQQDPTGVSVHRADPQNATLGMLSLGSAGVRKVMDARK